MVGEVTYPESETAIAKQRNRACDEFGSDLKHETVFGDYETVDKMDSLNVNDSGAADHGSVQLYCQSDFDKTSKRISRRSEENPNTETGTGYLSSMTDESSLEEGECEDSSSSSESDVSSYADNNDDFEMVSEEEEGVYCVF